MRKQPITLYSLVAIAALASVAGAQTGKPSTDKQNPTNPPAQSAPAMKEHALALQRGGKLIGMEVRDRSQTKIGKVEDLILRPNGEVAYIALDDANTAGKGKLYLIPWKSVQVGAVDNAGGKVDRGESIDHVVLTLEKDRWTGGPTFERSNWNQMVTNRELLKDADKFYGSTSGLDVPSGVPDGKPVDASSPSAIFVLRGSQIEGLDVVDATGKEIGEIKQIIIDPRHGRVNFVELKITDGKNKTVAVPWEAIRSTRKDDKTLATVSLPVDTLRGAPEWKDGDDGWKAMSEPKWVNDLYTYYSIRPYWTSGAPGADVRTDRTDREKTDRGTERDNPKRPEDGKKPQ